MKSSGCIFTIYVSKNKTVSHEIQTRFRRFPPARFTESFGRNFTIYVSKNEAVSCEIQTQFRSFLPASFAENAPGALSRFLHPKTKLFAMSSDVFWKFSLCEMYENFWTNLHDLYVQKRSCLT